METWHKRMAGIKGSEGLSRLLSSFSCYENYAQKEFSPETFSKGTV
jgi:hypothetical protein